MNLSHLTSDTLRNLIPLTERRDELIKSLRALESDIAAALTGTATAMVEAAASVKTKGKVNTSKRASGGRADRGQLKEQILSLLETAGSAGLGVKEIADQLGTKVGNVYVWFSSTGKTLTSRVAPGRYAVIKSSAPAATRKAKPAKATPIAKTAAKAKPAATKPVKAKRRISPAARKKMAAAAKARWEKQRAGKAASKPAKAGKPGKKAPKAGKRGFRLPAPE